MKRSSMITERVYQVGGPGLSDSSDCCVYLVDGGSSLALIDAGCGRSPERIVDNIQKLGFHPERVGCIIATHGHIDHIGGLAWLAERLGAKTAAHQLELPAIQEGRPELTAALMYGVRYVPVTVDRVLTGDMSEVKAGEAILHCLYTPGHTQGGVSVFADLDGVRVLFGQDIHGPFSRSWGSDLKVWRESMHKLLGLRADVLCEGHFGCYSPADAVEQYIRSYLERPAHLL